MGNIIRPQKLRLGIEKSNISLENLINNAVPVKTSIESYVGETELTGKSYKSHKEYLNEGHLPAIASQLKAARLFKETNDKYINYINTYLGDSSCISETLLEFQISSLNNLLYGSNVLGLEPISEILEKRLNECRSELDKMNTFISLTAELYPSVLNAVNDAKGKVAILEGSTYDVSTQTYDMSISTDVDLTQEEQFIKNMEDQFGFDEETGAIMWDIYNGLNDRYTNQKEVDWRFTRIMGGFKYDDGIAETFAWNQTSGLAIDLIPNEKEYIMSLGISESDYNYARYKVRIQAGIVGGSYGDYEFMKDKGYDSSAKKKMSEALGIELTDDQFKELWNEQYELMNGKNDYAHQQITTATILASDIDRPANNSQVNF